MERLSYILDRRSIRRFTSQIIDLEDLKKILTADRFHAEKVKHNGWEQAFFQD